MRTGAALAWACCRAALCADAATTLQPCRATAGARARPCSSMHSPPPGKGDSVSRQVIVLPKLSHQMTSGRLVRWLKRPGDKVDMYDILMEIETDELVESVFKVGDFAGTVSLLVESQEEGYVAHTLVRQWVRYSMMPVEEGSGLIPVGKPLAVFVETEDDLREASSQGASWVCPTSNVYDDTQPAVKLVTWQSFLKSAARKVKCMG